MADCKPRSRVPGAVNLVIRRDSPRVVETEPENFREVVQRLTGLRRTRHQQPRSRPSKNAQRLRRSSSFSPSVGGKVETDMTSLATTSLPATSPLSKMENGREEGSHDHHRHREVRIDVSCGFGAECNQLTQPTLRSPDSVLQMDRYLEAAATVWPTTQDACSINGLAMAAGSAPAVPPSWAGSVSLELLPPAHLLQDSICASASTAAPELQEPVSFFIGQTVNVHPCECLWDSTFPICPINDHSFPATQGTGTSDAELVSFQSAYGYELQADLQEALSRPSTEFEQLAIASTSAACKETATPAPSNPWFWVDDNLDERHVPVPMPDPQPPSIFQLQTRSPWDGF